MTAEELGERMGSNEFTAWQAWYGFGCDAAAEQPPEPTPAFATGDDELYARLTRMFGKGSR